ncbi:MAG: hypothetical protein V3U49_01315 [Nitrososphaerales archaeon]
MRYRVTFLAPDNPCENVIYVEKEEMVGSKGGTPAQSNAWMTWETGLNVQKEFDKYSFKVIKIEQMPKGWLEEMV